MERRLVFEQRCIVVNGVPWATTAATRFRIEATLPGGASYENEGVQCLRLRWAAIVEDRLYEDTERLCVALRSIANAGSPEALAPPLRDAPSRARYVLASIAAT